MKPWKKTGRRTLVNDRWISIHADTCELPNGHTVSPFYVIEEKEWVHIVALNSSEEILLTRQYRYAANVVCSELPCGAVEAGEQPLDAAKRELQEETGHVAHEWVKIGVLYANPARQTNRIHCYLARGLGNTGVRSLDDTEEIAFSFVSQVALMRQIKNGDFSQALHVASYFLSLDFLKSNGAALSES